MDLISVCRHLHHRNLTASADGNVSVRQADGTILITPSGVNKAFIEAKDLVTLQPDGTPAKGKPSSELKMHLEVYRACPEAKAVVHAHPPTAIAWSIAFPQMKQLPVEYMSELILALGEVPIVPFARPGTQSMAEALHPYLPHHRALILGRHGALAWGETLDEAYNGLERIEHAAQILKDAVELAGGIAKLTPLPHSEVQWLKDKRKEIGPKTL